MYRCVYATLFGKNPNTILPSLESIYMDHALNIEFEMEHKDLKSNQIFQNVIILKDKDYRVIFCFIFTNKFIVKIFLFYNNNEKNLILFF